ncbi:F0F1 ATP synthase subunit A [Candidatus Saganbacteria bacterium]|nr:F0F1 ATP synthase subunit A [Candidatus Saganbacteria bacterium]
MEPGAEVRHIFWPLKIFNFDISITSSVVVIWLAALAVFLIAFLATRRLSLIPGRLQNIFEVIYEFLDSQTRDLFGDQSRLWLPFIVTLFCFVLVANLCGLLPEVYPINANINTTATLALFVFFVYHWAGIREKGIFNYLKSLLPQGIPIFIMPLMAVVEILAHLARPFSLAIRLFSNMTAGHMVGLTLISFIFMVKNIWFSALPVTGKVLISMFEVFVAFIQAYVFAYLASLYIGLAIKEEH